MPTTANGIDVENTNADLVIQNCVVENGSSTYNSGIYLMNATNVEVLYNTISDDWEGIWLHGGSNNTIAGNQMPDRAVAMGSTCGIRGTTTRSRAILSR